MRVFCVSFLGYNKLDRAGMAAERTPGSSFPWTSSHFADTYEEPSRTPGWVGNSEFGGSVIFEAGRSHAGLNCAEYSTFLHQTADSGNTIGDLASSRLASWLHLWSKIAEQKLQMFPVIELME